jgi:hypothetical protein
MSTVSGVTFSCKVSAEDEKGERGVAMICAESWRGRETLKKLPTLVSMLSFDASGVCNSKQTILRRVGIRRPAGEGGLKKLGESRNMLPEEKAEFRDPMPEPALVMVNLFRRPIGEDGLKKLGGSRKRMVEEKAEPRDLMLEPALVTVSLVDCLNASRMLDLLKECLMFGSKLEGYFMVLTLTKLGVHKIIDIITVLTARPQS